MFLRRRGAARVSPPPRHPDTPPQVAVNSPADVDAQVTADAAGFGVGGVGLAEHHPAQLHDAPPLPYLTPHTHTHTHTCQESPGNVVM